MNTPRPADLALARRLEGSDAARCADYAHARPNVAPDLNPAVLRVADGVAIYAGENSPYSGAVGLGLHGPVARAEFDRLEAFYRGFGISGLVCLCPLADRSLVELVNRAGYRIELFMHAWYRELLDGERHAPAAPGVVTRPIRPDEVDLWVRVAFSGGLDSDDAQPHRTAIVAAYPYMAHTTCYLAWLDGVPAGAAALTIHNGVANLFGASTRPCCRGRGVQAALLARRLTDAAAAGCDLALTHTEPGGPSQRNIERLGFRLAYTKTILRGEE